MTRTPSPLNELIRKLDSDYYDPKAHGEGYIITWHSKNREVMDKRGFISDLFNAKHHEYYFVRSHTKPIVIKNVPFEWHEGTSEVSLSFNATFKLRITSEDEAKQLVKVLSQSGSPEVGLLNLIDKNLYSCMDKIFRERQQQEDKNLLSDFYGQGLEKGESLKLNEEVTREMQIELKGTDFGIGFTLQSAPERFADFKYDSQIKETGLEVSSECQLTLNNYQAYRKSGIQDIAGVISYMKEGIDRAIRQHILGKSEMELLSNFKTSHNGGKSISASVKESVEQQARAIGYELKSFHTLPNIAPLQLLNGLMLVFDEEDGSFKTGIFGGRIRLNMRMEVKAIEGEFDKYRHLFSSTGSDNQIDLLNITQEQILNRIKSHLAVICKEVLRQHQDNHLRTMTNFETEVKPALEEEIIKRMEAQHGLAVDIKTLMPVESEDATRLEELRKKKCPFEFSVFSTGDNGDGAQLTFASSFEVLGLDLDNPASWDAFEGHKYGYRIDCSERHKLGTSEAKSDRQWKTEAISLELKDIEHEIVRFIESSDLLIPDLNMWLHDRQKNQNMQEALINATVDKIKASRGLCISLERINIQDSELNKARIAQRRMAIDIMQDKEKLKAKQQLDDMSEQANHQRTLTEEITKKKVDLIEQSIESFDGLDQANSLVSPPETSVNTDRTMADFLPNKQQQSNDGALDDIFGESASSTKKLEEQEPK